MSVTVNINGLSLAHRGSSGVTIATLPDVCKTPPTPVPVPYPNISRSSDLAKGTTTVSADGGNSCAINGSEFSKSEGDEAGTAGGVTSGTFMKEATWISFSPNVMLEGAAACRLTDKMLCNHGNTACLGGEVQAPLSGPPDPKCSKIAALIEALIYTVRPPTPPGGFPQGMQGMATRWREYAENVGNRGGRFVESHINEYRKQQTKLKQELERWDKNDCDNKGPPLPAKAREYAAQEPQLGPGAPVEPTVAAASSSASSSAVDTIATTLGVGAGVAIGIVVVTRLIRLIPPLWPLQLSPI